MRYLDKTELTNIVGGASISGTLVNSIVRGINAFLELGRSIGTAIRRIWGKSACPI